MIAAGLSAKTIRDSKLAPIRAILQWATDSRKLPHNPAERITIKLKAQPSAVRRGYSDDEARTVLAAALSERSLHLRWVPGLCAYTGARVSEICQLRAEDVLQIDGIWCLPITAEAGWLKNINSERVVPIHSTLLSSGFLELRRSQSGPFFKELAADRLAIVEATEQRSSVAGFEA
jgi:integrase